MYNFINCVSSALQEKANAVLYEKLKKHKNSLHEQRLILEQDVCARVPLLVYIYSFTLIVTSCNQSLNLEHNYHDHIVILYVIKEPKSMASSMLLKLKVRANLHQMIFNLVSKAPIIFLYCVLM